MLKTLRTYLFLVLTFGLVGVQTACACNHNVTQHEVTASDHCHEMTMMDGHNMPAPELDEDCDHAPSGEFMTARSDVGDDLLQPAFNAVVPVHYALADMVPDEWGTFDRDLRPRPPPDLPFERKTVFLN